MYNLITIENEGSLVLCILTSQQVLHTLVAVEMTKFGVFKSFPKKNKKEKNNFIKVLKNIIIGEYDVYSSLPKNKKYKG